MKYAESITWNTNDSDADNLEFQLSHRRPGTAAATATPTDLLESGEYLPVYTPMNLRPDDAYQPLISKSNSSTVDSLV
ncbi:hypothetical protein PAXINDRAFT_9362 [Paxillus involutus ATCC 200175]|nr:hypothetical protein PAXINDRAFT_9362 [Paxillus involutus ATCC 200175]